VENKPIQEGARAKDKARRKKGKLWGPGNCARTEGERMDVERKE